MTATVNPAGGAPAQPRASVPLDRAAGIELLGPVPNSGYRNGAALVRRADGQMVQLGPLMYALLECADGRSSSAELAQALSNKLERQVETDHVSRLAEKLSDQGLLAGTEHRAPPRRNPLLALRWKVLVTNTKVTERLVAPFVFLLRPWVMWPVLAAFVAVFWFVLIHKGVASGVAQAFHSPGLLLLIFALGVVSAGFHELGHAAACRYGGARPGGMGAGLYLVWPAFYTDVTDAYRLPRRDRLRVDLAGLYFNTVIAVVTMAVWLAWRVDALLLLAALQLLLMAKQLSPVIRADGYHILADATGVPDLYAHLGPTLKRLIPGRRREPAALTGGARWLVTAWVLVIVPILAGLLITAVLLLPRLATSAWDSGHVIVRAIPHETDHAQVFSVLASLLRLVALALPVLGSVLIAQRFSFSTVGKARAWSAGNPPRRAAALMAGAVVVAGLAYAWWPSGQYKPVRPNQGGTLQQIGRLLSSPGSAVRPAPPTGLAPGTHLAVAMIPANGASRTDPAVFFLLGGKGRPADAVFSYGGGGTTAGTLFPFTLPAPPGPGDSQALAENTRNGSVLYKVVYSLVTVQNGAPVTETNSAYALADCKGCTTVAVSFQVILVVGESNIIDPIDAAGALNYDCPACMTTALADQMVVTLTKQPPKKLLKELQAALARLNALSALGAEGTPAAVAAEVTSVEQQIASELQASGLLAAPLTNGTAGGTSPSATSGQTAPTTAATPSTGSSTTAGSAPTTTTPPTTATSTTSAPTTTTPPTSG